MEKLDHAERVLDIMGELRRRYRRAMRPAPWAERAAPRRRHRRQRAHGGDMRLSVFHYPSQGWIDAVVMNVLMGKAIGHPARRIRARLLPAAGRGFPRHPAARAPPHGARRRGADASIAADPASRARRRKPSIAYWTAARRGELRRRRLAPLRDASAASACATARTRRLPPNGRHRSTRCSALGLPALKEIPDERSPLTEPRRLESYVCGEWVRGTGAGTAAARRRDRRGRRR